MLHTSVTSSNIAELAWANDVLYILFNRGRCYAYQGASIDDYNNLALAPSVGIHFHQCVRDQFDARELTAEEKAVIFSTTRHV